MELRLLIIMGLAWLYLVIRFISVLPIGPAGKFVLAALVLAIAQYQQVTSRYFGSMASPELPRWLLILLGWAFAAFFLFFLLLLLRDALALVAWALPGKTITPALLAVRTSCGLGILALALSTYGSYEGLRVPKVRHVEVSLPHLPPAFDGYQITQLTDLHISRLLPQSWISKVVDKTNALQSDLIVLTGDLQDGSPQARAQDITPLSRLHAPDGVFAIVGNHEYYTDYAGWLQTFARIKLPLLINTHVTITRDDAVLALAGITDRQAKAFAQITPDVQQAVAGIPADVPIILLSHRPDTAPQAAAAGVDLQLSGHTHGGQIAGLNHVVKRANDGYLAGLYRVHDMQLYVSRGTGLWNGLIVRLGAPSEITRITLRRAP